MFKKLIEKRMTDLEQDYPGITFLKIMQTANFYGQLTKGLKQVRGNGVLAVSEKDVLFYMWLPKKKVIIPRGKIKTIEIVSKFLKKIRYGQQLIKIEFENESGQPDACAWMVDDVKAWENFLISYKTER